MATVRAGQQAASPTLVQPAPLQPAERAYVSWHQGVVSLWTSALCALALLVPLLPLVLWLGHLAGMPGAPQGSGWDWELAAAVLLWLGSWLYINAQAAGPIELARYCGSVQMQRSSQSAHSFVLVRKGQPDIRLAVPMRWQMDQPVLDGREAAVVVAHVHPRAGLLQRLWRRVFSAEWAVLLDIEGQLSVRDTLRQRGLRFYVEHALADLVMLLVGTAGLAAVSVPAVLWADADGQSGWGVLVMLVLSVVAYLPVVALLVWLQSRYLHWRHGVDFLEAQRPAGPARH